MRRTHAIFGALTLVAFLGSGAYMRLFTRLETLPGGEHMLFVSRHIYMLGLALAHLLLATYLTPFAAGWRRRSQAAGSGLLGLASVLLIAAFVVEPIGGLGRSAWSSLGLYAFGAGAMLHVAGGWRQVG